jgi:hypothetical protein
MNHSDRGETMHKNHSHVAQLGNRPAERPFANYSTAYLRQWRDRLLWKRDELLAPALEPGGLVDRDAITEIEEMAANIGVELFLRRIESATG